MIFTQPSRTFAQPARRCLRLPRTVLPSWWAYPSNNWRWEGRAGERGVGGGGQMRSDCVISKLLCALTKVCTELPGKQSPSDSVTGVPATASSGGIQQSRLVLWRGRQSNQHRGLLWHLFGVHEQVWCETKVSIHVNYHNEVSVVSSSFFSLCQLCLATVLK